mgnify:CR=1 FL=1
MSGEGLKNLYRVHWRGLQIQKLSCHKSQHADHLPSYLLQSIWWRILFVELAGKKKNKTSHNKCPVQPAFQALVHPPAKRRKEYVLSTQIGKELPVSKKPAAKQPPSINHFEQCMVRVKYSQCYCADLAT